MLLALTVSSLLLAAPQVSRADEYHLSGASAFGLLSVGLMIVDAGAAVANGFALAHGTASKPTSYFSIAAGVVSYGMVAVVYAAEDDTELANQFAVMMGSAGTAALVTGAFALRQANRRDDSQDLLSRVRAYPTVVSDGGGHSGPGIQLKFSF